MLFLKLCDHGLKRLQHKSSFVLSLAGVSDRRAFRFADKLAIGTKQSAQQPRDADKSDEQRRNKPGKKRRPVNQSSVGSKGESGEDYYCRQKENSGEDREQDL